MTDLIFVHGMFQNPVSWENWIAYFSRKGFNCVAPAWPLHAGDPRSLRSDPPAELGDLTFADVIESMEAEVERFDRPVMIGHSVGGLLTQVFLDRGLIAGGVAISPVAPNGMIDLDWGFIKNSAVIANPLKGDAPVPMDARTFHSSFANTLSEDDALHAFEATATHDSRNVLRGCMGAHGKVDVDAPHGPLLLIAGEEDEIVPAHLVERNFKAYTDVHSVTELARFAGRSHFICNEPGWQEVAEAAHSFLERNALGSPTLAKG